MNWPIKHNKLLLFSQVALLKNHSSGTLLVISKFILAYSKLSQFIKNKNKLPLFLSKAT
jgi:hypothetical protein